MANENKNTPTTFRGSEPTSNNEYVDTDALKLAEMGYTQGLQRNFSVWSVLGVSFSLTNSWFGISAAMVAGISSGGPVLLIYGIIIIALISSCVAVSLSQLASAMPNAGGQYFWANELAPKRYANFASYLTGWFAWLGSIFTTASVALPMGSAMVGLYRLTHEDFVIQAWHVVLAYEFLNAFAFIFNTYGRVLSKVAKATLYISLLSFFIIIIVVPAKARTHQSARFVFATFINNTGWDNSGIAFIIGLMSTNWAFTCLDCAVHLAEEVARPEKMIPIAICGTVAIGFVTAWLFSMAMMFSLQDLELVTNTPTYVPILELFHQAVNTAGACALETLIILTGIGCLVACHTWQSRLCWSFARDGGLPGHHRLKKVSPRLHVPLNAHFLSCILVGLVGMLYLASTAAFNSMVTACIVLLYVSYSIPVVFLLHRGRNNIRHGPFWLGKIGVFADCVLLLWTVFTTVMYSFPAYMPARASNANYVSAVYFAVVLIIMIDWCSRGRQEYRGQEARRQEAVEVERLASAGRAVGRGSPAGQRAGSINGGSGRHASVLA